MTIQESIAGVDPITDDYGDEDIVTRNDIAGLIEVVAVICGSMQTAIRSKANKYARYAKILWRDFHSAYFYQGALPEPYRLPTARDAGSLPGSCARLSVPLEFD